MNRIIPRAFVATLLVAPLGCEHNAQPTNPPQTTQAQIHEAQLEQSKEKIEATQELNQATTVLREMTQGAEIGKAQRDAAHCVMIVPNMGTGAFIVGGQKGNGVVSCRSPSDWSAPAFIRLSGVTVGLQAGGQSADLIVLANVTDAPGKIFSKNFQFGAGASVAAGPLGTGTNTGASTSADYLTYARTRGLFAGVDLSGVSLKADDKSNAAFYGNTSPVMILSGQLRVPHEAMGLVEQLRSSFPKVPPAVTER